MLGFFELVFEREKAFLKKWVLSNLIIITVSSASDLNDGLGKFVLFSVLGSLNSSSKLLPLLVIGFSRKVLLIHESKVLQRSLSVDFVNCSLFCVFLLLVRLTVILNCHVF